MKKYITSLLVLTFMAGLSAYGQNINPTVEVTNKYQGSLLGVNKPYLRMDVPDSLLHFNLDFDYSIFNRPYKGAYDFSPYILDMKPKPDAYRVKSLYLRAGAGYSLHPVFDLIYSPNINKRFNICIYAFHNSYIGRYRNISVLSRKIQENGSFHRGYDAFTQTGINGSYAGKKAVFAFDMGYIGIHSKDTVAKSNMNVVSVKLDLYSRYNEASKLYYNADLQLKMGNDKLGFVDNSKNLLFQEFIFDGTIGSNLGTYSKMLFNAAISGYAYQYNKSDFTNIASVTPKYVYDRDRWRMELGAKFELPLGVYPHIIIGFEAVKKHLNLYTRLTGGAYSNSYFSQKVTNRFFNPEYGRDIVNFFMTSKEFLNASIGMEGNIASVFRFDVRGGTSINSAALMPAVYYASLNSGVPSMFLPGVNSENCKFYYLSIKAVWDKDPFVIDGNFKYNLTKIDKIKPSVFAPAPFSGKIRGRYNFNHRIYAGVYIDYSSSVKGSIVPMKNVVDGAVYEVKLPGFVDLGLTCEYKISKKFSVWASGGNMLNMNIQRVPLYPESGINVTGGICLNL